MPVMPERFFLTAGLRLGQPDVIETYRRPFESVEEHDKTLIDNWNEVISDDDMIWVLGDLAYGTRDQVLRFTRRLNGRKVIMLGNIDRDPIQWWVEHGFGAAMRKSIVFDKTKIRLSYAAHHSCAQVNLHGCTEGSYLPNHQTVSVERWDWRPVQLRDVLKSMGNPEREPLRGMKIKNN